MSMCGILRLPVPPSSDCGRGRCGVAYSGFGFGFFGVGAGVTSTRSGRWPGRGMDRFSFGDGSGRFARLRCRSASRACRKERISAWWLELGVSVASRRTDIIR